MKKWKIYSFFTIALTIVIGLCTHANAAAYYFNNAVNTDPTELGNYWNDLDTTDPAIQLPNLSVDQLTIVSGAEYVGDAVFRESGSNNGMVTGNALFIGDESQNNGSVSGTKTREYTTSVSPSRDFVSDGPWTVIANRTSVDITGTTYDTTTTFSRIHGGTFTSNHATYYFDNRVNTDPTEAGNYCLDSRCGGVASSLPIFGLDEINILAGAVLDGDIIFNGAATNEGTVNGNATFNDTTINNGNISGNTIFNEDNSENSGTITGTKTRRYNFDITVTRDFVTTSPWTVVADGAIIDLQNAIYDNTTTRSTENSGTFVLPAAPEVVSVETSSNGAITIVYDIALDENSVPSVGDFTIKLNGEVVSATDVTIEGTQVSLTTGVVITGEDSFTVTYTPSTNPIKSNVGVSAASLTDKYVVFVIPVTGMPGNPFFVLVGSKLYSPCGNSICVIDTVTDTVIHTIAVGSTISPRIRNIGKFIYVGNSGNKVSVIDSDTDTVTAILSVGTSPAHMTIFGTKIYVSCSTTTSIIDAQTNTVIGTLPVTSSNDLTASVGTTLYIPSKNTDEIYVVDTGTDTIVDTISVPNYAADGYSVVVGDKIYYEKNNSDFFILDTTTNSVIDTFTTDGQTLIYPALVNGKIYVNNFGSNTVSVIDINTNTVVETITVEAGPYTSSIFGTKLFVPNAGARSVSVVDTALDANVENIPTAQGPVYGTIVGPKIYFNSVEQKISVINTPTIPSQLPNLTSFSTSSSSGTYHTGQSIPITAHFGRPLQSGSTMTILLNSGASVVLNNVSGATLSGTYVIGSGDSSPDLAVRSITSASVSDTNGHTRTSYDLPASQGSFTAENSFITRNIGDAKNIQIGTYQTFATGSHPYQLSSPINGKLYVANQGAGTVSVIDQTTGATTSTISVGSEPYGLALSGTTLYVANTNSDTVSAIDTATNTVTATIPVGVKPYYVASVGSKVYVTNGASNSVSVINANTNTVSATIPVGSYPRGIKAHGTDLYVANYGDPNYSGGNYISVIDSNTDTVTDTILLPTGSDGPRGVTALGSKVYVTNFRSNNVSVIDTNTDTITATIPVGMGPRGILGTGTTLYVENFDDGTISVIDTNTNTVTKTVTVGSSPAGMSLSGTTVYITAFQDDKVYALDTTTNTLIGTTTPDEEEEHHHSSGSGGSSSSTTPSDCLPGYRYSPSSGRLCPVVETQTGPSAPGTNVPAPIVLPGTPRLLKLGTRGADVLALQQYLNTHNFIVSPTGAGAPGHETTLFGAKTKAAVIKFQLAHHLKGDGIVGPLTRAQLK